MAWLIEVLFIVVLVTAGHSFWACFKAPGHLRNMLNDTTELTRLIEHIGMDKLVDSTQTVEPIFGSYEGNIIALDKSHYRSLSQTRNLLGVLVLAALGGSWFLGKKFLIANVITIAFSALVPIPAPTKNNNFNHLVSIMLNLIKWLFEDPVSCLGFCEMQAEYGKLGDVLAALVIGDATKAQL